MSINAIYRVFFHILYYSYSRVNGEGRVVLEPQHELDAVAGGRGGVARQVDGAALHGRHARLRN